MEQKSEPRCRAPGRGRAPPQRLAELEPLQARVVELEERVDFTERLLRRPRTRAAAALDDGARWDLRRRRPRAGLPAVVRSSQALARDRRTRTIGRARRGAAALAEVDALKIAIGRGRGTVRFRRAAPRARQTGGPVARGSAAMITREDIQSCLDRLDGGGLAVTRGRAQPLAGADARTMPRWWCTTRRRWSSSGSG